MKNPLRKRLLRELKEEFGKYLVIFLFMLLTIGFISGYLVAGTSMMKSIEKNYDTYQIEDGHFILKDEASPSFLKKIENDKIKVKIYSDFYKEEGNDTDGDGKGDTTLRVYAIRKKVNKICLMDGKMPKKEGEIGLDRMYAKNNGIKIGDRTTVGDQEYLVTGVVALSDYSALFSDNSDMMFDTTKFGVAVMTDDGYDRLPDTHEKYQYDWLYDKAPKDDKQEQKMSEKLIESLAEQTGYSNLGIDSVLPSYTNQAIHFAEDDIGSDYMMMIVLLYILILILAFIFSVTIRHTIVREAAVIGTLRASGYTKGELFRHYMTVPIMVTVVASLIGNILGYTVFKNMVADLYYGSYCLPTFKTLWNGEAFILTTVIPFVIMVIVNGVALMTKLQLSPLRFLRRDLDKKKKRKAMRLPKLSFFNRFRLRVIFQNMSSYITLFFGMLFVTMILLFGTMMRPLLSHYQDIVVDNMLAKYQYVLKAQVPTENESAEKYCMTSLQYQSKSKNEDISVMGLEKDSKYFKGKLPEDGVTVSDGFLKKYQYKVGDTITLHEEYSNKSYQFHIVDKVEYPGGLVVFMDIDAFRAQFDEQSGDDIMSMISNYPEVLLQQLSSPEETKYFTGYLSDEKLTDIDEKYVDSCITQDDLTKMTRQLDVSMGSMFDLVNIFAVIMAMLVIYLLTKLILERNTTSISMVKILGYENKEIASLYLMSTTWMVLFCTIVGLALSTAVMTALYRVLMMSFSGWLTLYYAPEGYPKMFGMIVACYIVVLLLQYRKIRHIPMDEALKNVE